MGVNSGFTLLSFALLPPPPILAKANTAAPTRKKLVNIFLVNEENKGDDVNINTNVVKSFLKYRAFHHKFYNSLNPLKSA